MKFKIIFLSAALAAVSGCDQPKKLPPVESGVAAVSAPTAANNASAIAELNPTQGNLTRGRVLFSQEASGVRVVADLVGLKPGEHGFHIHENGDCSAPDAKSAGDHFNPEGKPHGAPEGEAHHAGDMGNIIADETGHAHLDRVYDFLTLSGTNTIVGRAFIVHGDKDDLKTQPAGNAGPRVACGVIEKQQGIPHTLAEQH